LAKPFCRQDVSTIVCLVLNKCLAYLLMLSVVMIVTGSRCYFQAKMDEIRDTATAFGNGTT
jgi:hypothetical protein